MPRDTQTRPPQDIPFWPDYMNRELGGAKRWVLAPRLTDRLKRDGHEIAIHPKRYKEMERLHREEVRAAVRLQMIGITDSAEMVDALLALPGLSIVAEDGEFMRRDWPGTELQRRRDARK